MEGIPKAVYTPEFRAEAVKSVEVEGLTLGQAAKRLSIPKPSLGNWVRATRDGKLAEVGKGQQGLRHSDVPRAPPASSGSASSPPEN